ncbi:MAG: serine/threonine protein phosphatase [Methanosarcinales archaeon]|jgi:serine/threonine-protein phosphatase PP1 catalytic subunit|nr:serine/threonine protein phosphatase [Methanosarcinales archaeon]
MSSKTEKDRLGKNIKRVKPLLKKEEAIVRPSFKKMLIATDIHGDYRALEFILKFAEKKGIEAYIFLGDYIDKGPDSVAVLNELLEMKLRNPKKIFLLRGNHETRDISRWFEFSDDLADETELLEASNAVFEQMPIGAVLNENIFCVHGCIAGTKHESLKDISKKDPKKYLWNDPGTEDGLLPSGRGGGIYSIGPDLIKKFMKQNDLQLIIRGHTSHQEGVKLFCDDRVISLYSTLPGTGPRARAAVAVLEEKKIKFYYYRKTKNGFEWEDEVKQLDLK